MTDKERQEFVRELFKEVKECYCTAAVVGNALFSEENKKHIEKDDWLSVVNAWREMVILYLDAAIGEKIDTVVFNIL